MNGSIFRKGNKKQEACTTRLLAIAYTGQFTSKYVEGVVLHIILIVCEVVANVDQAFINLQGPQRRGSQEGFTHAGWTFLQCMLSKAIPSYPPHQEKVGM